MFAFLRAEGRRSETGGVTPHFTARRDYLFKPPIVFYSTFPLLTLAEK